MLCLCLADRSNTGCQEGRYTGFQGTSNEFRATVDPQGTNGRTYDATRGLGLLLLEKGSKKGRPNGGWVGPEYKMLE